MPTQDYSDSLSPLKQRTIAIALLLLTILLVVLLIILPLIHFGLKLNAQKHDLAFKLHRYEKIIASKHNIMADIEGFQEQNTVNNYFNTQETEALASANIQELLKTIIVNAGGQLRSTQVASDNIDSTQESKFIRVPVKITMTVNSATLRTVLYNIENALPLMIINQLVIKPAHDDKTSNQLDVELQVVSFMRKTQQ